MATGKAKSERWKWQTDGALKRAQRGEYSVGIPPGGSPPPVTTERQRRDTKFYDIDGVTPLYGQSTKKPALADVGVYPDADTVRTNYNASSTQSLIITTEGATFQNLNIYGDIKVRAANVSFINCRFYGGPQNLGNGSDTGIVDANNVACVNLKLLDCTLIPQKPDYYRNAVLGHKYTAERCYAFNCNDGFGAYAHPSQAGNLCDVFLYGNYVESMVYWANDPAHTDGTHNDCIQYQGGHNFTARGNVLIASSVKSQWSSADTRYGAPWSPTNLSIEPYDVWVLTGSGAGSDKHDGGVADLIVNNQANGAGIILQDNVGKGTVNVIVDGNWFDRGLAQMNIKPTTGGGSYTITNNRMGRNSYAYSATSKYTIRVDSRANTSFSPALLSGGNIWEDNSTALTESTTGGVRYNA